MAAVREDDVAQLPVHVLGVEHERRGGDGLLAEPEDRPRVGRPLHQPRLELGQRELGAGDHVGLLAEEAPPLLLPAPKPLGKRRGAPTGTPRHRKRTTQPKHEFPMKLAQGRSATAGRERVEVGGALGADVEEHRVPGVEVRRLPRLLRELLGLRRAPRTLR